MRFPKVTLALIGAALAAAPAVADEAVLETSEKVVVTATRSAQNINKVPASVSVIDADAIEDAPAKSLDEILRRTPSVDLPNASSYQVHPTANSVSMRGLGGIRALVMLDGVPINDPFFGYVQWSRVPLENIKRVEIVRGAQATLWGNYAMGGVINIITRKPTESGLVVQGGGGSYGSYRTDLFGSWLASDDAAFSVSGGANHTDGFMQIFPEDRGPINVPTAFTTSNGAFRGDVALGEDLSANLRIDYFENEQTLQTRLSKNDQRTWNYSGGLSRSFGEAGDLGLSLFGSSSQFFTQNTGGFTGIPENEAEFIQNVHETPVEDAGGSLVWSDTLSGGWLAAYSIGLDYHRIAGKDEAAIYDETGALVRIDVGRGKQQFWGAFAQLSLKPVDPLEILASVRYQTFENYDAFDGAPGGLGFAPDTAEQSVDPRVSLRYQLSDKFALRGAAYTAFRAPNLDNLYRAFSIPFGVFLPNAGLTPETLKGAEVGFDVVTGKLRLQATAYHNTIDDLITSRNLDFAELPLGFFFGSKNINAGSARAQGAELELSWDMGEGLSSHVAYTFADSKITENALDPASVGKQLGGIPRNRASFGITYASPDGWRIAPHVRWIEASFADNAHTLPVDEQFVVDLAASYALTDRAEAYVQIENLLDADYVADNSGFNPRLRGTPFTAFVGVRAKVY